MKKYFKIFLLLFVVFIGINEVKAEDKCYYGAKYKDGKYVVDITNPDKVNAFDCSSGEYYFEINFSGDTLKIENFKLCSNTDANGNIVGDGRYFWAPTDNRMKAAADLKKELFYENGALKCTKTKVCASQTDADHPVITTECDGKEAAKTKDTSYHGLKKTTDVGNMCSEAGETIKLLRQVYTLLRYLIPVLIIVLSIVDFMKVVLSGEEKVFKEAWNYFIKRIIIGIVILLVPILIKMLINMAHINGIYKIGNGNDIFCIFS